MAKNLSRIILLQIKTLRPKQWIKNFFLFAGVIFSQNIFNLQLFLKTFFAFVLFCLISSSIYILNDIVDKNKDKAHEEKKSRPIASGELKIIHALLVFFPFVLFSIFFSFYLNTGFGVLVVLYFLLGVIYSLYLKNLVIIDSLSIAGFFLLRVIAGAVVVNVAMSSWFLLCATFLSLFIAFHKRRNEIVLLNNEASAHRKVLDKYSLGFLDQMIAVVTALTIMSYSLYTMSPETVEKFGTTNLIFTIPFVLYGLFRYLYLVHQEKKGGSPTDLVVGDCGLFVNIVLWVVLVFIILYVRRQL
ncbi:hypothetical protein A3J90_08615 [candidate division WOR-1 bacterium RIFOXYC2_FULL_37_10]|uniref:Phosphoribose diphosphate--decaprenyl-phosphate phosphoribosyltransferase n=1 Tax=candidate division WOR-1 bacterium RIFOXYB2_FULL_37_13 TaxID=1802579 RepID=A0A1F4SNM9_UNCSA|nr:MAG: hypothetical protein A2310_06895 [candidate division WOR-1 bacterium RIFOXYB2_FULL_37_13]OGC33038.1 MAG: hypothetical protein A3J90_08615 [candidate division WOR-1 bacterium RIFOXYC2_FULL_37_10]